MTLLLLNSSNHVLWMFHTPNSAAQLRQQFLSDPVPSTSADADRLEELDEFHMIHVFLPMVMAYRFWIDSLGQKRDMSEGAYNHLTNESPMIVRTGGLTVRIIERWDLLLVAYERIQLSVKGSTLSSGMDILLEKGSRGLFFDVFQHVFGGPLRTCLKLIPKQQWQTLEQIIGFYLNPQIAKPVEIRAYLEEIPNKNSYHKSSIDSHQSRSRHWSPEINGRAVVVGYQANSGQASINKLVNSNRIGSPNRRTAMNGNPRSPSNLVSEHSIASRKPPWPPLSHLDVTRLIRNPSSNGSDESRLTSNPSEAVLLSEIELLIAPLIAFIFNNRKRQLQKIANFAEPGQRILRDSGFMELVCALANQFDAEPSPQSSSSSSPSNLLHNVGRCLIFTRSPKPATPANQQTQPYWIPHELLIFRPSPLITIVCVCVLQNSDRWAKAMDFHAKITSIAHSNSNWGWLKANAERMFLGLASAAGANRETNGVILRSLQFKWDQFVSESRALESYTRSRPRSSRYVPDNTLRVAVNAAEDAHWKFLHSLETTLGREMCKKFQESGDYREGLARRLVNRLQSIGSIKSYLSPQLYVQSISTDLNPQRLHLNMLGFIYADWRRRLLIANVLRPPNLRSSVRSKASKEDVSSKTNQIWHILRHRYASQQRLQPTFSDGIGNESLKFIQLDSRYCIAEMSFRKRGLKNMNSEMSSQIEHLESKPDKPSIGERLAQCLRLTFGAYLRVQSVGSSGIDSNHSNFNVFNSKGRQYPLLKQGDQVLLVCVFPLTGHISARLVLNETTQWAFHLTKTVQAAIESCE